MKRRKADQGKKTDLLNWKVGSQWVKDDPSTDPDELPEPTGWRILVRPLQVQDKTEAGIILTSDTQSDAEWNITVGRILAVGPLAWQRADMGEEAWAEVGDYVLYAKYSGHKITYQGTALILLNDDGVLMRIPSPELLFQDEKEKTL